MATELKGIVATVIGFVKRESRMRNGRLDPNERYCVRLGSVRSPVTSGYYLSFGRGSFGDDFVGGALTLSGAIDLVREKSAHPSIRHCSHDGRIERT